MNIQKNILLVSTLLIAASSALSAAQSPSQLNRHTRVASDLNVPAQTKVVSVETKHIQDSPAYINRHTRVSSARLAMNHSRSEQVSKSSKGFEASSSYINRHTRVASERQSSI
ncbi:MAG: hypothetical protein ACSHYA_08150 [Opitutaceae bacterium]